MFFCNGASKEHQRRATHGVVCSFPFSYPYLKERDGLSGSGELGSHAFALRCSINFAKYSIRVE